MSGGGGNYVINGTNPSDVNISTENTITFDQDTGGNRFQISNDGIDLLGTGTYINLKSGDGNILIDSGSGELSLRTSDSGFNVSSSGIYAESSGHPVELISEDAKIKVEASSILLDSSAGNININVDKSDGYKAYYNNNEIATLMDIPTVITIVEI